MASTTTTAGAAATPRFVLRAQGRLSSNAGLHPRPWLARLNRALRDEAFALHYQPIVALRDGAVAHHEALVRLADEPDGRLLAPAEFLPAAERYGLVRAIDRLVVSRVVALLSRTPELLSRTPELPSRTPEPLSRTPEPLSRTSDVEGVPRSIAVNMSALSVTDRAMLGYIEGELLRHNVDPGRLVIEITETAAISDMRRAQAFCEGVLGLGCAVALDDFGVGFGSLYYAKRLPFTYLKIDGDFVRELPASRNDRLLVTAIVDVARGMGRETIAEFVGDQATVELLGELGVDYAQGFHIGRPARLPGA